MSKKVVTYSDLEEAGAPKELLKYIVGVFHKIDPWKPPWIFQVDIEKLKQDKNISKESLNWLITKLKGTRLEEILSRLAHYCNQASPCSDNSPCDCANITIAKDQIKQWAKDCVPKEKPDLRDDKDLGRWAYGFNECRGETLKIIEES